MLQIDFIQHENLRVYSNINVVIKRSDGKIRMSMYTYAGKLHHTG